MPDLDAIVVPVSGGGLIGGWATAARHLRPGIAIYGAEPETADDTKQSLAAGQRVEVAENPTIADGLRVTSPGKLTFPIVQETVQDILLVSDAEMIETLTWMLERMKVLVEPSGAAGGRGRAPQARPTSRASAWASSSRAATSISRSWPDTSPRGAPFELP